MARKGRARLRELEAEAAGVCLPCVPVYSPSQCGWRLLRKESNPSRKSLESPDAAELKRSQTRLKTKEIDLLQFHNVSDPQQSLAQFKAWKAQGVCRYIGITSTRQRRLSRD